MNCSGLIDHTGELINGQEKKMGKTKIAIACQGGGSQTAFTAGILKTLFDNNIHHQRKIIGLTGTSEGALNAALAL